MSNDEGNKSAFAIHRRTGCSGRPLQKGGSPRGGGTMAERVPPKVLILGGKPHIFVNALRTTRSTVELGTYGLTAASDEDEELGAASGSLWE